MNISPRENLTMALDAVWTHRFRSMLTILGIVIGITTVVTVASLLTGLRAGVVTFFDELGPDNIFVFKTSGDPGGNFTPPKEQKRRPILREWGDVVARRASSVEDVSVALFVPGVTGDSVLTAKVPGFETDRLSLAGVSPNNNRISVRLLDEGRYFTDEENDRIAHVAVLGNSIAQSLFPAGDGLNKSFILDGAEYTIVGIFSKAKGGFFGENGADLQIILPLKTAIARYPQLDRFMITAKARPGLRKDAFEEVRDIIRRLRHLTKDQPDDFSISTPDQIVQQFDKITGLVGLVAIAISALGLLVGGIGVMNIMLVSVTERTREIGIRKALGARRFDVVGQFLAEAMALTGVGGILGIVVSVAITALVGLLIPSIKTSVPSWAVITAFTVSVAVGLFFGVWPAVKASRLDPVEALRYE